MPATLESQTLTDDYAALLARVEAADAADDPGPWIALARDWNALKARVHGAVRRASYKLSQDLSDESAEAEEARLREQISPIADEQDAALTAALLASEHRGAVAAELGDRLLTILALRVEALSPKTSALRVRAGEAVRKYDKRLALAEVEVLGERMTISKARNRTRSERAEVREAAFRAHRGWFRDNRASLAGTFQQLVELRHEMGQRLGHETFLPIAYAAMMRTDYGPAEVEGFRASVMRHLVPLMGELLAAQAREQGQERLRPWDLDFDPQLSLPTGIAEPIATQLDRAGRVFERLDPQLAERLSDMRERGLIDLENRKNKAAGAFCISFPDTRTVAVFCNSTGDARDVSTLLHEMGHAFQGWASQAIEAIELRNPSLDACEIHSMGMEFLAQPALDEFFSAEDVERFTRLRWRDAVSLICYACVVDAFQHHVYRNPHESLDARDRAWEELYDSFLPGLDWSGIADLHAPRWYAQMHIFHVPLYYIDYALAELCAMQLALMADRDRASTLETYLELCRLGGTRSLFGLLESAGMRSPLADDLIADLAAHARGILLPS